MADKNTVLTPNNSKNSANTTVGTMSNKSTKSISKNQMKALEQCMKDYGNALKRLADK